MQGCPGVDEHHFHGMRANIAATGECWAETDSEDKPSTTSSSHLATTASTVIPITTPYDNGADPRMQAPQAVTLRR